MEISCNDALTLFKKWNSDSTEIRGVDDGSVQVCLENGQGVEGHVSQADAEVQ